MTACTNNGGKARRVVTAALVGVLSVGAVPAIALATGADVSLMADAGQEVVQATVEYDGKTVVENQFMNVGLGVHVATIRDVLDSRGVRYDAEEDVGGYRIVGR